MCLITSYSTTKPIFVTEALQSKKRLDVMQQEAALSKNKTWTLVHLPSNRTPIGQLDANGCLGERNYDGFLNKYKARLVDKGFSQQHGFD
jgi:histone deacetylase 1/2